MAQGGSAAVPKQPVGGDPRAGGNAVNQSSYMPSMPQYQGAQNAPSPMQALPEYQFYMPQGQQAQQSPNQSLTSLYTNQGDPQMRQAARNFNMPDWTQQGNIAPNIAGSNMQSMFGQSPGPKTPRQIGGK